MSKTSPSKDFATRRLLPSLLGFLFLSAVYLYGFPQPNVFYAGIVLLHVLAGIVASVLLIVCLFRLLREGSFISRLGWLLITGGAVFGLILIKTGTPRAEWNWLYLHM